MKRIVLTIFALSSFVYVSCSSDDNNPEPEPVNLTFVKAKVDGVDWNANSFQGSYINNIVSIEANSTDNRTIEISVQNVSGTGNHALGNVSIGAYEEGSGDDETYTTAGALGTGTINFSVLTRTRAEGTFSFTGGNGLGDSKVIASGSFKIDLTD